MSDGGGPDAIHREGRRLLRTLRSGGGMLEPSARKECCIVRPDDGPPVKISRDVVTRLQSAGLVAVTAAGRIRLTTAAAGLLPDGPSGDGESGPPRRVLVETEILEEAGRRQAAANAAESPLGLLSRRKDKSGRPFLTRAEVEAGERLRTDYTRGQILPRMGANWQAAVASGRRDGSRGSVSELTDAALGARRRAERALVAVGPELAGVLVDICCFLKGLETVEMERRWPARSAKIVLKTGLSALARHYAPPRGMESWPASRPILHWGTADYRPRHGADRQGSP